MSELHKDPIDFGTQLAESERQYNVSEIQRRVVPKQLKNPDGSWPTTECEDCGIIIPLARLEATGAVTCIACANEKERRSKLYAKS